MIRLHPAKHHLAPLLLLLQPLLPAQSLTRGPAIWESSASSFLVAFQSASNATGRIEWGPTEALGSTTSGPSTTDHAIRITGLLPDHFYWYRVRLGNTVVTPTFRTRTFPASGSDVSFFVFGDCGSASSDQMRVASLCQSWNWDLGLLTGDIVYPDGQASGFDPRFFTPYAPILRTTPHYPVLGNHDVHTPNGQPWQDAFYLPTNNSGTERWYSFDFGKCHFIGLDSTQPSSQSQKTWLRSDLQTARSAGAAWIFVTLHHPPYSSGTQHGRSQSVFSHLCPIFEEFEVDAVFTGHDHIYERSMVIKDYYPNNRGVVYFVAGTGGAGLYGIDPEPYSAYARSSHGVLKVDVRGNVFRSVFLDGSSGSLGTQRDAFSMTRGPVTAALRATSPDPEPGQTFSGAFDAPNGSFRALFASLQPGYANVPGLGLLHLGTTDFVLSSGMTGSSQTAAFSLGIPNQSALVGEDLYFQGLCATANPPTLGLTHLLYSRIR
ncbi:MAG TPA: metallophosphoesterase [Planctomycetota bacterium]